jgi:hypothetical protein
MEIWRYGDMEMWRCGDVEMWRCEDVEMWRCKELVGAALIKFRKKSSTQLLVESTEVRSSSSGVAVCWIIR